VAQGLDETRRILNLWSRRDHC